MADAPGHRQPGAVRDEEERRRTRPPDRHRCVGGVGGAGAGGGGIDGIRRRTWPRWIAPGGAGDRGAGRVASWHSDWWWPTKVPERQVSSGDAKSGRRRRSAALSIACQAAAPGGRCRSHRRTQTTEVLDPGFHHRQGPTGGCPSIDLSDVRGQHLARRALEVAAAGGHHLLMVGPPGSGKTMLATRLPGLLPPLDRSTALETTRVHSVAGLPLPPTGLVSRPPFRSPHHGTSPVAMIGGGTALMRPGEISMSHGGVLFLDELGEFSTVVLDALRQPLEDGQVRVSRARGSTIFPARFILVASMNPCPCGEGGACGSCRCSDSARERYARRLSGPLLDRFDIAIWVDRPQVDELISGRPDETTATVAARVASARRRAADRGFAVNAELPGSSLDAVAPMTAAAGRHPRTQGPVRITQCPWTPPGSSIGQDRGRSRRLRATWSMNPTSTRH